MTSTLQTAINFLSCIAIGLLVFSVYVYYSVYRKNVNKLNALKDSKLIKPDKIRFILAWIAYSFIPSLFGVSCIWLYEREFPSPLAWLVPLILFSQALPAYPYYTIAINHDRINGPTQWGWLWKRVEISMDEIDRDKSLRQPVRRALGTTIIYSTNEVKIRTLGLNDQQLSEIMRSGKSSSTYGSS